jgi:deoxyribodipyrimidine photo-lyase
MPQKKIIIWYRNDLRIHDHKALHHAIDEKAHIIPVYCFDSRQFTTTSFGFPKTGKYRAQFLLESIQDLRNSLQKLDSDLIVRQGLPEKEIVAIAKQLTVDAVYYHQEVTAEELIVENKLNQALQAQNIAYQVFWGSTLYIPEDLPFKIDFVPELFTDFRKQIEKKSAIEEPLPTPEKLSALPNIETAKIPTITELGLKQPIADRRVVLKFIGGESAALQRLKHYFWDTNCLRSYKETRNEMLGADYSSKFSPWLALGCISPRYIYDQVKQYEKERTKNDSTYWLVFELMWRDFFRFICAKHGNKIFYQSGLQDVNFPWKQDWKRFNLWTEGKTGYPLVDANMREIAATGFMSNRGRQNVASFLTKNLGINWQMGAEWFESLLIDYDVCSNWGNWNYTAGIGNDARGFRYFNIPKQSKDYDSKGDYLRHWLPELTSVPSHKIHEPWKLNPEEQRRYNVQLGVDYPRPVVDFFKSIKANEAIYQNTVERLGNNEK